MSSCIKSFRVQITERHIIYVTVIEICKYHVLIVCRGIFNKILTKFYVRFACAFCSNYSLVAGIARLSGGEYHSVELFVIYGVIMVCICGMLCYLVGIIEMPFNNICAAVKKLFLKRRICITALLTAYVITCHRISKKTGNIFRSGIYTGIYLIGIGIRIACSLCRFNVCLGISLCILILFEESYILHIKHLSKTNLELVCANRSKEIHTERSLIRCTTISVYRAVRSRNDNVLVAFHIGLHIV